MIKRIALTCLIASTATFAQSDKPKNVYKTFKLSTSEMIFSCQNGADPTTKHLADSSIVVSCGATLKATWDGKRFQCPEGLFIWADETEALSGNPNYAYCRSYPLNK